MAALTDPLLFTISYGVTFRKEYLINWIPENVENRWLLKSHSNI
jgi:hypothetical protein